MLLARFSARFTALTNHLTRKFSSSWTSHPEFCYKPHNTIAITFPQGDRTAEVEIIKAFTPFMNSAALVVDACATLPHLPKQLVLKLADRRSIQHLDAEMAWTPKREPYFQRGIKRYIERKRQSPVPLPARDISSDEPIWVQELFSWSWANKHHLHEREAYERLTEGQELRIVPRYYGSVRVQMDNTGLHPALDHIDGLLFEYIPGRTMSSISVGADISVADAEDVSQKVLEMGRHIRCFGISHNDTHFHNIILRESDNSPVLIDWGLTDFRVADEHLAS